MTTEVPAMSTTDIATVVKMMETLPEDAQGKVSEHLREYIQDLLDELHWESAIANSQPQLVAAARQARAEIVAGLAEPLDERRL